MEVVFAFQLGVNIRSGVLEQKEREDLEASNVSLSFHFNVKIDLVNEGPRNKRWKESDNSSLPPLRSVSKFIQFCFWRQCILPFVSTLHITDIQFIFSEWKTYNSLILTFLSLWVVMNSGSLWWEKNINYSKLPSNYCFFKESVVVLMNAGLMAFCHGAFYFLVVGHYLFVYWPPKRRHSIHSSSVCASFSSNNFLSTDWSLCFLLQLRKEILS